MTRLDTGPGTRSAVLEPTPIRLLTGIITRLIGLMAALGLLGYMGFREPLPVHGPSAEATEPIARPDVAAPAPEAEGPEAAEPEPEPTVQAAAPAPPVLDTAAIEKAQEVLESAQRDQANAAARVADAEARVQSAQLKLSSEIAAYRGLTRALKDPTMRIEQAQSRLKAVTTDLTQLRGDLNTIAQTPRPRAKPLNYQSPVARPATGDEAHFELRGGRITYIDIEGLMDRLKTDARIQLRLMSSPRPISGQVGPVGAFSIQYAMVPTGLGVDGMGGGSARLNASYGLSGWEIVPTQNLRGETFDLAMSPASDFSRAVTRLNPARDTVTLWVYPDGFEIYRALRDLLHERGFMVSARPLPADIPIRGSPTGSVSAAQ